MARHPGDPERARRVPGAAGRRRPPPRIRCRGPTRLLAPVLGAALAWHPPGAGSTPTTSPTASPTTSPTTSPTGSPTTSPTVSPTAPTTAPTMSPTSPTTSPTIAPTSPTAAPTGTPSGTPTSSPTPTPPTTVPFVLENIKDGAGYAYLTQLDRLMDLAEPMRRTPPPDGWTTLFAPINAAIDTAPSGVVDMLRRARPHTALRRLLRFHLIIGLYSWTQLRNLTGPMQLRTHDGGYVSTRWNNGTQTVFLSPTYGGVDVSVTVSDIGAINGRIHAISGLLQPPTLWLPRKNMTQTALEKGYHVWYNAVRIAGLEAALDDMRQTVQARTCFVPTDEAFNRYGAAALAALLSDPANVRRLIQYHCVYGYYHGDVLAHFAEVRAHKSTLYCPGVGCRQVQFSRAGQYSQGDSILITDSWANYTLRQRKADPLCLPEERMPAAVHIPDIFSTSGIMHEITRVMMPQGFQWPGVGLTTPPAPYPTWTVWPTPWLQLNAPNCRRIPYNTCPQLLPLNPGPIIEESSSEVWFDVEAWCNGLPLGGLASSTCSAHSSWQISDSGWVLSTLESQFTVTVAPGNVLTLLLIDLSNSINQNEKSLTYRKAAATRYIETVLDPNNLALTGPHYVAVYAFDGRATTQVVSANVGPGTGSRTTWSDDKDRLVAAINALVCDGSNYCQDPSTNLHGALIWGMNFLDTFTSPSVLGARNTTCGAEAFLVFFTDGLDQANYRSAGDVISERLRIMPKMFAVGHEGTDSTAVRSKMVELVGDPLAVQMASSRAGVPDEFEKVAQWVVNYASRAYRIRYCSPRRAGDQGVVVRARHNGVTGPPMEFVVGERVRYVGHAFGFTGASGADAVVTEVDRYNIYGDTYRIYFPQSSVYVSVLGSHLNRTYDANRFFRDPPWRPTCLRHRTTGSSNWVASEDSSPYTVVDADLVEDKVAPYSCVGGSEFACSAGQCQCAALAPAVGAMCPLRAIAIPAASTALRECTDGFPPSPVAFNTLTLEPSSRISATFTAACGDSLPFGGISFSSCDDLSSLKVYESDSGGEFARVSRLESRPRVSCISQPAHVISLLLIDTSDSVLRGAGGLAGMKASVLAYLDGIKDSLASHMVAIHTFDGRRETQMLVNFTSDLTKVRLAVQNFQCDGTIYCADPASNLFGAIVYANNTVFRNFTWALEHWRRTGLDPEGLATVSGVRRQPYLVVFTDGADTACYATEELAVRAAGFGRGVISVGLQGEVPRLWRTYDAADFDARGVNVELLSRISTNGVFVASSTDLHAAFAGVGQAIATASATQYRLDYCTPKRTGVRRVRLEFTPDTGRFAGQRVVYWEGSFNASTLDCRDGRCDRCLGQPLSEMSCDNQPVTFEQSFVCVDDATPVKIGKYCRCPCADSSRYTDAEGPGPVACQVPGTCYGDRPTGRLGICQQRGGLRSVPTPNWGVRNAEGYWQGSDGTRFGVSSDSHISFQFIPQCADQWPIPGLRISACPSLSDFSVYETDASVGAVFNPIQVDPWESEPRVVCNPNIVSLILLDTSGSIRHSEGGVAALQNAVAEYLDRLAMAATELDITHTVGIYAFDGRSFLQEITGFTDSATAKNTMASWSCSSTATSSIPAQTGATLFCQDPSTDLNGALMRAEDVLSRSSLGQVWTTQRFLILFTDGTDQAARVDENLVVQELQAANVRNGMKVFGVGLTGESKDAQIGLDLVALQRLAWSGFFVAATPDLLGAQFAIVAGQVRASVIDSATTTYRIDYCSPKRSGLRQAVIRLTLEGQSVTWTGPKFDAGEFNCQGGACSQCLRHRQFTCLNQPQFAPGERDPQFFSCGTDDPIAVDENGVTKCKCPCQGTFPPYPVTPVPVPVGSNLAPTATVSVSRVTVAAVGQSFVQPGVLTSVVGPEGGQTVTAVCTAAVPALFSAGPVMTISGTTGSLSLTAATPGTSLVTCVLTDNGSPVMSATIQFSVVIAGGVTPPSPVSFCPVRTNGRFMRVKLNIPASAFSAAAFGAAVQAATSEVMAAPVACVAAICPSTACEPPTSPSVASCPGTADLRASLGCLTAAQVPAERAARPLQAAPIYVDFDVTSATDAGQQTAMNEVNSDITRCPSCILSSFAPSGPAVWVISTPTPAPTVTSSDDSSLTTALIILIVAGCVLLCVLVGVALYLCGCCGGRGNRDSGDRNLPPEQNGVHSPREMSGPSPNVPGWSQASPQDADPLHARSYPSAYQGDHSGPSKTQPSQMQSRPYDAGSRPYSASAYDPQPPPPVFFATGQAVRGLYLDGQWYDAVIADRGPDGTYAVQWADGSYSEDIPEHQLEPADA
eukprot:TRINITY_DN5376_c0_g3_i1.p1 TRINITY_DN5376_c0_g3~~TRINITY_DN5376_c0_g3_i1.p1  ORF type:complete len:2324 (+),score=638.26 TRINITY_DN5376_c0_g3_i1:60-6974(+)